VHVASIDLVLIAIYCAFVLAIGFLLRRQMVGSAEFFRAGRSMPAWVAGPLTDRSARVNPAEPGLTAPAFSE
jgi:hypothetical protein